MNMSEMAEKLDVSLATVSRICSGERKPSLDLMMVIEEKLGWDLGDQANEVRCDAYYDAFRKKMEAIDGDSGT